MATAHPVARGPRPKRSSSNRAVDFLLGRHIATNEAEQRKIGPLEGVPAMGLDGLGSSAYGPEAALTILMPLGAASLSLVEPIVALLVALLAVLYVSYRQTVAAYPSNGGAYVVARENLGETASLLAAAAIMIDYILNVAVGISAGVAALISAVPSLHAWTLPLCLGVLVLITLINLRGTQESGRVLALPTYGFVACFLVIIGIGVVEAIRHGGVPTPVIAPPPLAGGTEAVSLWLLLRAFASGCTAMTGVEAVSNGVNAFRAPVVRNARATLSAICAILGLLLIGIAYLGKAYKVGAMDQSQPDYQSVLSQLCGAVVGHGWFYYVAMATLLCVLALSANTSFVGFPRLCRLVAEHGYLPKPFAVAGRRLVYSVGILYLAVTAGLLLIAFGGITDRLIPLFAIGAFATFTLSQAGMVAHWLREARGGSEGRNRVRLGVNALGTATTAVALAIIVVAKFAEGAWITVLAVPLVIFGLKGIHGYYVRLAERLRPAGPLDLSATDAPVVLVATRGWDRLSEKALRFAVRLSPDVVATHLLDLDGEDDRDALKALQAQWRHEVEEPARLAGGPVPRLMVLQASYRRIHAPLLKLIERIQAEQPDRIVAVLVPVIAKPHWWQALLHTRHASRLSQSLLRYGGDKVVVINVPLHVGADLPEDGLIDQERPAVRRQAAE
ncbi:APC family permease [Lichenihabitans sp. Uapishka_5]|uniref:APC family permease n=1 Tax=Lichenihabitans sp. Uapishka_5 TaxID=3037302 RepID=UPI0029E7E05F|nr:APC family permease [Lichenihabitans sp. Uapishka_5]MDX7952031.1 APC family permease [Lichenihabitans sp. Uapishka_5]